MAIYQIQDVSFTYPNASHAALHGIHLTIEEGDFVLLCGPSGSGKTTLLRQLKREIRPEGNREGEISYRGASMEKLDERSSVEQIGVVFQDPDNQIVMNTAWQELAFGMENIGYPSQEIQRRIGELVHFFGIEDWLHLPVHELSGGQKQLLNLASVMTLRPQVLLLDEPTAQLDPIAAKQFIQLLVRLNEELGITVIISEHRVEELFAAARHIAVLHEGRLRYNGDPNRLARMIWQDADGIFIPYLPSIGQLFFALEQHAERQRVPLTVKEGRQWLKEYASGLAAPATADAANAVYSDSPQNPWDSENQEEDILECKELYFQYDKQARFVLRRLSLSIRRGEWFTVLGGNGAGKSTLLHHIAGALKPQRGTIRMSGKSLLKMSAAERSGRIGFVAQNPLLYFTRDTVREQLTDRLRRLSKEDRSDILRELTELFGIEDVLDRHPYDLSGGQQQKVALALVLLAEPELLLLDEPTKGLDPLSKQKLAALLQALRSRGTTILMVSHDVEFAAHYATRCGLLFDGRMAAVDETKAFLANNYFYTTTIQRAAAGLLQEAVTVKDIVGRWGDSR